ncbi:hypothetical protein T492DRAFT_890966 [Pavlovales sp. CCMP2436]|nr:hypothetical protein T492DRAFT_890966 [Pavlovales sp. CCMP2436]
MSLRDFRSSFSPKQRMDKGKLGSLWAKIETNIEATSTFKRALMPVVNLVESALWVVPADSALLTASLLIFKGSFPKKAAYVFIAFYTVWLFYQVIASFELIGTLCLGDICI